MGSDLSKRMRTAQQGAIVNSFIAWAEHSCPCLVQPFEEDEADSGRREAEAYALLMQEAAITDVQSFTAASSRAAVAASAAATAVAVTKVRRFVETDTITVSSMTLILVCCLNSKGCSGMFIVD